MLYIELKTKGKILEQFIEDNKDLINLYPQDQYESACKFVVYVLSGDKQIDAYCKTFPDRCNSVSNKHNSSAVYSRTKLVQTLLSRARVSSAVINMSKKQDAFDVLHNIALHGKSELARVQAAKTIIDAIPDPIDTPTVTNKVNILTLIQKDLRALAHSKYLAIQDGELTVTEAINKPMILTNLNGDYDGTD